MQNLVEGFNGLWQQKVWQRFHHRDAEDLQATSDRFIRAWCARRAERARVVPRVPLAPAGEVDLRKLAAGTVIYLRRCDEAARLIVLGHRFALPREWAHRLVRVEVDLSASTLRCYGLRRREPQHQPLLLKCPYSPPARRSFHAKLTSINWH